jgi:hypothetical protein
MRGKFDGMADKQDPDKPRPMTEAERRNARRAAALRENLRRRKARERAEPRKPAKDNGPHQ